MMDDRSEKNLKGVHSDLVQIVRKARLLVDSRTDGLSFIVTEGLRTQERQRQLFKAGASRTMNSRHLTGHAVDLAATVEGDVRWDWPLYNELALAMKLSTGGVPIVWGGDWKGGFRDGPHFELARSSYPA
jgi:peptidoglycan L-alanyl-D-glutamate endopeptidase CwlK